MYGSLVDAVHARLPTEDRTRVLQCLCAFVAREDLKPWENIVWVCRRTQGPRTPPAPGPNDEGVVVDIRTTLSTTEHPLIPSLVEWIQTNCTHGGVYFFF